MAKQIKRTLDIRCKLEDNEARIYRNAKGRLVSLGEPVGQAAVLKYILNDYELLKLKAK